MATIDPIVIGSTANVNDSAADIFTAAEEDGDTMLNDERSWLMIKNTGSASVNITVAVQNATQKSEGSGTITFTNMVITIDASGANTEYAARVKVPMIPYNNSSGKISLTYTAHENLMIAMFKLDKF